MTPWRRPLEASIHAEADDPTSRFVQLATNTAGGYPAARTLVFRRFDGDRLLFAIDARSRKVDEVRRDPKAEACWYFMRSREQYRLRGALSLHDLREDYGIGIRSEVWATLSENVRLQYIWPQPGADWSDEGVGDATGPAENGAPPPTFAVLALDVHRVDHLALRADPPTRQIFERDASEPVGWRVSRVNP